MEKPRKALLIIDVQEDFTGDKAKMSVDKTQGTRMIANINKILDDAQSLAIIPAYIGNEFSPYDIANIFRNNAAIKGRSGTKLDARLKIATDNYFPKHRNDAFTNSDLDRFLKENNVRELYLTGLFAEGCVYGTIKGAIKNHYSVNVVTDCLAAKSDKKLDYMIGKYKRLGINCLTVESICRTTT